MQGCFQTPMAGASLLGVKGLRTDIVKPPDIVTGSVDDVAAIIDGMMVSAKKYAVKGELTMDHLAVVTVEAVKLAAINAEAKKLYYGSQASVQSPVESVVSQSVKSQVSRRSARRQAYLDRCSRLHEQDGYCYLLMVKLPKRQTVYDKVGAFPGVMEMLALRAEFIDLDAVKMLAYYIDGNVLHIDGNLRGDNDLVGYISRTLGLFSHVRSELRTLFTPDKSDGPCMNAVTRVGARGKSLGDLEEELYVRTSVDNDVIVLRGPNDVFGHRTVMSDTVLSSDGIISLKSYNFFAAFVAVLPPAVELTFPHSKTVRVSERGAVLMVTGTVDCNLSGIDLLPFMNLHNPAIGHFRSVINSSVEGIVSFISDILLEKGKKLYYNLLPEYLSVEGNCGMSHFHHNFHEYVGYVDVHQSVLDNELAYQDTVSVNFNADLVDLDAVGVDRVDNTIVWCGDFDDQSAAGMAYGADFEDLSLSAYRFLEPMVAVARLDSIRLADGELHELFGLTALIVSGVLSDIVACRHRVQFVPLRIFADSDWYGNLSNSLPKDWYLKDNVCWSNIRMSGSRLLDL